MPRDRGRMGLAEGSLSSALPVEFLIFGLTLVGVALFHRHALPIAAAGLAAVIASVAVHGFPPGPGARASRRTSRTSG